MHKTTTFVARIAMASIVCGAAFVISARHRAYAQDQAANVAPPAPLTVFRNGSRPPEGAIILFSGKREELASNFYKRYTKNPGDWTVDVQGVSTPNGDDTSRRIIKKETSNQANVYKNLVSPEMDHANLSKSGLSLIP